MKNKYITTKHAAAALGVDTATVRAYLAQGKLKGKFEGVGNRGTWLVDVDSARQFPTAVGRGKAGAKATRQPKPELLDQV